VAQESFNFSPLNRFKMVFLHAEKDFAKSLINDAVTTVSSALCATQAYRFAIESRSLAR
jgi:hypothetical protein